MVRYLYGLKSGGEARRKKCTETFQDMYFMPTVADLDIYFRRGSKPNGEYYYELLLVYMDHVLCCLQNHQLIMDALELACDLKD